MGSEKTQFKKGTTNNPGGLTAEEREARDAVRKALAEPGMRATGLAAYRRLLEADNPVIVKDFMDRLAGKVKEHVELSGVDGEPLVPLEYTSEDMVAMLKARLERAKQTALQDAPPVK